MKDKGGLGRHDFISLSVIECLPFTSLHFIHTVGVLQAHWQILARAQLGTAVTAEANLLIHSCQIHFNLDGKSVADNGKALCQHSTASEWKHIGIPIQKKKKKQYQQTEMEEI